MKKSVLAFATAVLLSMGAATAQTGTGSGSGTTGAPGTTSPEAMQTKPGAQTGTPGSAGSQTGTSGSGAHGSHTGMGTHSDTGAAGSQSGTSGTMGTSGTTGAQTGTSGTTGTYGSQTGTTGSSGTMGSQTGAGSQTGTSGAMGSSTGAMGATGGQAGKMSRTDRQFAEETTMANRAEMELSRLASTKATNPAVKQFANMMVQDHQKSSSQLMSVAQQKNVNAPDDVPEPDKRLREKLQEASGSEADMMYMKHMYVAHVKDLASFQLYSQTGQDPDLKRFATQQVPVLQQHLRQIESILGQMGVTVPTISASR